MRFSHLIVVPVVLSVTAAGCGWDTAEPTPAPTMMGKPFSPYSHEDEPFAQELFNEQASLPMIEDGELEFLPGDYDAKFTHVKRFERRSLVTSQDGPTIWFFGGSTLFGIGQRDEHTIPSEVARLAASEDTPVQVSTFGFPSFAS